MYRDDYDGITRSQQNTENRKKKTRRRGGARLIRESVYRYHCAASDWSTDRYYWARESSGTIRVYLRLWLLRRAAESRVTTLACLSGPNISLSLSLFSLPFTLWLYLSWALPISLSLSVIFLSLFSLFPLSLFYSLSLSVCLSSSHAEDLNRVASVCNGCECTTRCWLRTAGRQLSLVENPSTAALYCEGIGGKALSTAFPGTPLLLPRDS